MNKKAKQNNKTKMLLNPDLVLFQLRIPRTVHQKKINCIKKQTKPITGHVLEMQG